jgi:hypothetical protein
MEKLMRHIGTFRAQIFKFLSFDPNTIFNLLVFDDRIVFLKVGSALNQLPQALLHLPIGPVGLRVTAQEAEVDPSVLREALAEDAENFELMKSEIITIGLRKKHWLLAKGSLTIETRTRGKIFMVFIEKGTADSSESVLRQLLGSGLSLI